jgi:hypothetical protein
VHRDAMKRAFSAAYREFGSSKRSIECGFCVVLVVDLSNKVAN